MQPRRPAIATLRNLAYFSEATRPLSPAELDAILNDARSFNASHEITGVLFYAERKFFQLIESSPQALDRVMERIRKSNAHAHLNVVLDQPTACRQFQDWHMAFAQPPASELQKFSQASWEDAMPVTRSSIEKPTGLMLALDCWSQWVARRYRPAV